MKELKILLAMNDMEDALLMDALHEKPQQIRKLRPSVILVAALLASFMILSVGAAISEAGWFQFFFEQETGQALTPGQIATVQTSTKEFGQSVTRNGYTVTLDSVIADPNNCYIKLRIIGPEGTVLDNEMGYGGQTPRKPDELYKTFAPVSGAEFSGVGSWQHLPDENPKDNEIPILYRWTIHQPSQVNFETDNVWRLTIRDLAAWGTEADTILAKGDICFDILFDKINPEQLLFVKEPVPYTFDLPGHLGTAEGAVIHCSIQSMGGSLVIQGCDEAAGFDILPVVMKDGSRVEMTSRIWGNGSYSYTLDLPIDLEEVDHILLDDGRKLFPIE